MSRTIPPIQVLFVGLLIVFFLGSCGGGGSTQPPPDQPPAWSGPSGVRELSASSNTISLSWEPATDDRDAAANIRYRVYYSTDNNPFDNNFKEVGGGTTTISITGLQEGTAYFLGVRPVDSSGNVGANSLVVSITTSSTTDNSAPTWSGGIGVLSVSPGNGSVEVSWNPASDNTTQSNNIKYRVYSAQHDRPYDTSPTETPSGITSWTVSGLMNNTEYFFCVRAGDEAGNWDSNTTVLSATPTDESDPVDKTAPTWPNGAGVSSLEAMDAAVKVKWNAAADDQDPAGSLVYRIYYGTDNNPLDDSFADSNPGVTSLIVYGLTNDIEYYFSVQVRDQSGNWDSNQNSLSAIPESIPVGDIEPPQWRGISGVREVVAGDGHIDVYWGEALDNFDSPEDIWYRVYYDTDPNPFDQELNVVTDLNVFEKGLDGLINGTTYYIGVRTADQSWNWDDNEVILSCTPQLAQYEMTLTIIDICADELTDLDSLGIDDEDEVFLQVYWMVDGNLQGTMRWPGTGHWSLQTDQGASNHCVAQQSLDLSRSFMVPRNGELIIGVQIIEVDDWGVDDWNRIVGYLSTHVEIPWLATINQVIEGAQFLGIDLHNSNDVVGSFEFKIENVEGDCQLRSWDEHLYQCSHFENTKWENKLQEFHYRFNGDGSDYPTWWRIEQTSF